MLYGVLPHVDRPSNMTKSNLPGERDDKVLCLYNGGDNHFEPLFQKTQSDKDGTQKEAESPELRRAREEMDSNDGNKSQKRKANPAVGNPWGLATQYLKEHQTGGAAQAQPDITSTWC